MKIVLLDPLPWRVRARLWAQDQVNGAGIWLVSHRVCWAARLLWRI